MLYRVYLAGPDVFLPNPKEHAEELKKVCAEFGLEGVFPLDAEISAKQDAPLALANEIFRQNLSLITGCVGVLANMTPFRGPSMDVGTAWEMGFAFSFGLPIVGYTTDTRQYPERVGKFREQSPNNLFFDPEFVENFGLIDNLMLDCSTKTILSDFRSAAEFLSDWIKGKPETA